jgi:hypothetical protein
MNIEKQYTVYGSDGLLGTRISRNELIGLIREHEPTKTVGAVLHNAHQKLAIKSGILTIIVLPARTPPQGNFTITKGNKNEPSSTSEVIG